MDIAATGHALPLLSPLRDRPQARPDNSQQANARNSRDNTDNVSDRGEGRTERVVPGEVIYSRPEQPRGVEAARRGLADAAAGFTASGNRRFSLQAALQTFRDNEALITEPGELRQVSGIIDEYV